MTAEQRAKVWELVDSISGIAIEVDIFANDISRYPVNRHNIAMCRRVTANLMAIAAELETIADTESKSE